MKLQFAFGANPKKRTKKKKKVAKRVKRKQNKRVGKKIRGFMAKKKVKKKHGKKKHGKKARRRKQTVGVLRRQRDAALKASKRKRKSSPAKRKAAKKKYSGLYKKIKKMTGRNPLRYKITDKTTKKKIDGREIPTEKEFKSKFEKKYRLLDKRGQNDPIFAEYVRARKTKELADYDEDVRGFQKDVEAYRQNANYDVVVDEYEKRAKRQKRKNKPKEKSKAQGRRKGKKGAFTKGGKRYIAHEHLATTRHVKKGAKAVVSLSKKKKARTYKGKGSFGKKGPKFSLSVTPKKGGKFSANVKFNPFRRNAVANIIETIAEPIAGFTGVTPTSVGSAILGGALIPAVNMAIPMAARIPVVGPIVSQGVEMIGPQAASSLVPLLAGAGMIRFSRNEIVNQAGMGMVVAGVIGMSTALVQALIKRAGFMSGVIYTPRLSGINYTPNMSGINYTPNMGIMPQLGSRADFGAADYGGGGGYTQAHNFSSADFGADFSSDSEAEHWGSEEDLLTSQMSGSLA